MQALQLKLQQFCVDALIKQKVLRRLVRVLPLFLFLLFRLLLLHGCSIGVDLDEVVVDERLMPDLHRVRRAGGDYATDVVDDGPDLARFECDFDLGPRVAELRAEEWHHLTSVEDGPIDAMGGEEGQLYDVAACNVADVSISLAQRERGCVVGNVGFEHHGHPTVEQSVVVDLDVVGDLAMQVQVELADRVVLSNDRERVDGLIDRPAERSLHLDRSEEGVLGLVEGRDLQVALPGGRTEYAAEALGSRQRGVEQAFEDPTEDLTEIGLQLVSVGKAILTVEEELSCVARRDRLIQ